MGCPWEDDVVVAQSVYHCSPTIGWSQNLLIGVHISHHQAPIAPATCWDCGHLFPARPQKGLSSTPPLPVTKRWLLACILALPLGRFPAWHCKPGGGKLFLKPMVGMSKWPTISKYTMSKCHWLNLEICPLAMELLPPQATCHL